MKKFTEIKESKNKKTKDSIKNELISILENLNIKVSGEGTENLSNVDIDIQGKEEIIENIKTFIDDIRIQERKNTLEYVKTNSFRNFDMKWLNEQIDGLNKVKVGNKFILNEKITDTQLGDTYRAALNQYFVSNLNGENFDGWEFNYDNQSGVFEFDNKELDCSMKATPFWQGADTIPIDVHRLSDGGGESLESSKEKFNIEEILFGKYKEILENFLQGQEWG